MDRLTFDGNFCDIAQCRELPCPYNNACTQRQVWEKLKAYEDLGLDPEECKRALNAVSIVRTAAAALGVPAEQLRNLVGLGEAGRLMVLPEGGERIGGDEGWQLANQSVKQFTESMADIVRIVDEKSPTRICK